MQFLCNAVGWLGFGWFPSRKIAIASDRRLASSASYYFLASYSILLTVLAYYVASPIPFTPNTYQSI